MPTASPHRPGRRPAPHVRRTPARASCRWSRTRTSPSAACCSSASAPRSPSAAHTLVVDAGERAGAAGEMALIDLGAVRRAAVAAGLLPGRARPADPLRRRRPARPAPSSSASPKPRRGCDVVLVHASAAELCRLFARAARRSAAIAAPCPIVLADDRPPSVTHAYAAMKLLAQRAGLVVHDLLLGAAPHSPRAERIAAKLADLRRQLPRRACCATGPGSTRPATPPSRRPATLRRLVRRAASTSHAAMPARLRRDATARRAVAIGALNDFRSRPCTPPKASWT